MRCRQGGRRWRWAFGARAAPTGSGIIRSIGRIAGGDRSILSDPAVGSAASGAVMSPPPMPCSGRSVLADRGVEGVALCRVAGFQATAQPAHPLFRGAMGEAVGHHAAGGLALERIVADRLRGGHAFLHVAGLQTVAIACGPDAGIAIRLQLQPHRQGIALRLTRRLLCAPHLIRRAEQILDVMAELVRDDIIAGEIALRAEAIGEFVEEAGVEIDAAVGRAVEGPHRRLRCAAARLARAGEEAQTRRREALAGLGEDLFPGVLGVAERLT
ncbi:hypothetical protein COLO4_02680, partial [Corchorus olitorius]